MTNIQFDASLERGKEILNLRPSASPEIELISFLLSSRLKDDFHRDGTEAAARVNELIRAAGLDYAAKAILLARRSFDCREAAFLAAGELSQVINGQPWASNFYRRLSRRPDDVLALLVYVRARYKKIPSRVKRGLGAYLRNCSEATLSAYKEKKHFSMKLVDAVNLLHPKHSDPLGKLVRGTLPEPKASLHGSNGASSLDSPDGFHSRNGVADGEGETKSVNLLTLIQEIHRVDLMA
jgi:hypothetical protein